MADHVLYSYYNGLTGETRIVRSWFGRERLQVQYRQIDEMLSGEQRISQLWKDADSDDRIELFWRQREQRTGLNRLGEPSRVNVNPDPAYSKPPAPPNPSRASAG